MVVNGFRCAFLCLLLALLLARCKDERVSEKSSPQTMGMVPVSAFPSSQMLASGATSTARSREPNAKPTQQVLPGQGPGTNAVTFERGAGPQSLTHTKSASASAKGISGRPQGSTQTMNSVFTGTKSSASSEDYKQILNDAALLHVKPRTPSVPVRGTANDPRFQDPQVRAKINFYKTNLRQTVNDLVSQHGTLVLSSGGEKRLLPKLVEWAARTAFDKDFSQLNALQQEQVKQAAWAMLGAMRERLHEMGRL